MVSKQNDLDPFFLVSSPSSGPEVLPRLKLSPFHDLLENF
jgi:hypothetical protein